MDSWSANISDDNDTSSLEMSSTQEAFTSSELNFYFWFYKVTIPTLYGIVTVGGTIGNTMVIAVISSRQAMRTTVNVLLLNLACSDLLFVVVCVPFITYHFVADDWAFGDLTCKLMQFLLYVTVYVTMYTLLLVAVVRYLTIVYPRQSARWRTRRMVCCSVGVMWGVMLLINVPALLVHRVKSFPLVSAGVVYNYCAVESVPTGRNLLLAFFLLTYALPLTGITILYLLVMRFLRMSSSAHFLHRSVASRRNASVTHIEERTSHATRILTIVVVVFAVTWLPLHLNLLSVYFWPKQQRTTVLQVYRGFAHFVAYANSAMNPVIYNYVSRDFRSSFRHLLPRGCSPLHQESPAVGSRPECIPLQCEALDADQVNTALTLLKSSPNINGQIKIETV